MDRLKGLQEIAAQKTKLSPEDEMLEDTACTSRYKSVFDNTPDMWRPSRIGAQ